MIFWRVSTRRQWPHALYPERRKAQYMSVDKEMQQQLCLLTGRDAFGRAVNPSGPARPDKKVGIFFWLWIGQPYASGVYDATKILAQPGGDDRLFRAESPESPDRQQHFWGEPLWGYYNSIDSWVIRKQLELLTLAGIDFMVFDTTNAVTYPNVYMRVLMEIERLKGEGWDPPRAAFYTHSYSIRTVMQLYKELYLPKLYPSTWYCEDGRPVIIAYANPEEDKSWAQKEMKDFCYDPAAYPAEVAKFFKFYKPQWPLDPFFHDGFPWVEWTFPQPLHTDVMSVTVASHPNVPFSFSLTRDKENWGRGWDVEHKRNDSEKVDSGLFFQSQWDHAIKTDPRTIFIGGWNEWIAYKQLWDGEYMLCDAVNREFSRDIEPMEGGYEDAFYIQMIHNIRRFKYTSYLEVPPGTPVVYHSVNSEPRGRDSAGVCETLRYEQPDLPNVIRRITVTYAGEKLTFETEFLNELSDADLQSFQILLSSGEENRNGFEGYSWRIATVSGKTGLSIQSLNGNKKIIKELEYNRFGKHLGVSLVLRDICDNADRIYFKAAIYVKNITDIMSYYSTGSALPPGRLSYMYPLGSQHKKEAK